MSRYYKRHPMAAQMKTYTAPKGRKPIKWRLSEEQAKRLGLPEMSENWECE